MRHFTSEAVLDNGARGLFVNVPEASVMSFYISFRAGEFLVPKEKWEAPHLMEHLILGANKKFPRGRDFQAEFEKNGAYSNASTGHYDITYEAECADFEWQRILDQMILPLTVPLFLEDEFHAEFGNVKKEELAARSNNHFRHLGLALREAYGYHSTTYKHRLELMENVELQDLIDHYKATHYTSNMRFVIAGNLTPARRNHIKKRLGNIELPKAKDAKIAKGTTDWIKKPLFIENDTVDNFYFYIDTFMNRRMKDKELYAMSLVNSMLTETLHSRILGEARERGLVYGMSSNVAFDKYSTNWWFGAQVQPKNASELFEIMIKEIKKVQDGKITDKDLKAAKQYRLGRFQRDVQTVSGLANAYMGRYFFEDVIEEHNKIPAHIKAVTKNQIVKGAKDLFSENVWGLGILGGTDRQPADKLSKQIQVLWK